MSGWTFLAQGQVVGLGIGPNLKIWNREDAKSRIWIDCLTLATFPFVPTGLFDLRNFRSYRT